MTSTLVTHLPEDAATLEAIRDLAVSVSEAATAEMPNMGALWRALADGRFRLVECFERDGRRYYVLHENLDEARPLATLDPREQQRARILGWGESEKAAAYALGVTPSAVSALLKTTLAKLGLRMRIDLVLLVRSLTVETAA